MDIRNKMSDRYCSYVSQEEFTIATELTLKILAELDKYKI